MGTNQAFLNHHPHNFVGGKLSCVLTAPFTQQLPCLLQIALAQHLMDASKNVAELTKTYGEVEYRHVPQPAEEGMEFVQKIIDCAGNNERR